MSQADLSMIFRYHFKTTSKTRKSCEAHMLGMWCRLPSNSMLRLYQERQMLVGKCLCAEHSWQQISYAAGWTALICR